MKKTKENEEPKQPKPKDEAKTKHSIKTKLMLLHISCQINLFMIEQTDFLVVK